MEYVSADLSRFQFSPKMKFFAILPDRKIFRVLGNRRIVFKPGYSWHWDPVCQTFQNGLFPVNHVFLIFNCGNFWPNEDVDFLDHEVEASPVFRLTAIFPRVQVVNFPDK